MYIPVLSHTEHCVSVRNAKRRMLYRLVVGFFFFVKNQMEHMDTECCGNGELVAWKVEARLVTATLQRVSKCYTLLPTKLSRNTVGNLNPKRSYAMWLNPSTISVWAKEILCTASSLYLGQLWHELWHYMQQNFSVISLQRISSE
jgi:hypothetical protein